MQVMAALQPHGGQGSRARRLTLHAVMDESATVEVAEHHALRHVPLRLPACQSFACLALRNLRWNPPLMAHLPRPPPVQARMQCAVCSVQVTRMQRPQPSAGLATHQLHDCRKFSSHVLFSAQYHARLIFVC